MELPFAHVSAAPPCPVPQPSGGKILVKRLASAHRAQVVAGGDVVLASCEGKRGEGNVAPAPNFNVMLADEGGRPLEFRTEGDCDTVLLVASAAGDWHYDDDGAEGGGARVRVERARAGRYDVWVGTYGAGSCRARLVLEAPA
jgi:hypothetical protein